jgi:acid phosphatase family membrane protein YuiD
MSIENSQGRKALLQRVKSSLQKAEKIVRRHKKAHARLLVTGMTSSAASTLVAGITAASGPVIGVGTEGWRLACIVAAVLGFTATISTGLGQQLKTKNHLIEGTQCIGRLKSLDVGLTADSRNWEDIVIEFEEIARIYPDFIS